MWVGESRFNFMAVRYYRSITHIGVLCLSANRFTNIVTHNEEEAHANNATLHGGDIHSASQKYGIAVDDWIDLSTGLNPRPYSVGEIPMQIFTRLPYELPDLCQLAAHYYGNDKLLAVSGTQLAIQCLPQCLSAIDILAPKTGYQEHVLHWEQNNVRVLHYPADDANTAAQYIDNVLQQNPKRHLLIINPNNPTGLTFTPAQIKAWANKLSADCYVIVDEAFMDVTPEYSVLDDLGENMIVMRSFGKFFGLAGVRLGFVFANAKVREALSKKMGLWSVNGPAQYIAIKALADTLWHSEARINIEQDALCTQQIFSLLFDALQPVNINHQGLFSSYWLTHEKSEVVCDFFARQGILIRKITVDDKFSLLRIGIMSKLDLPSQSKVKRAIKDFILTLSSSL
jgi:cobalamin biosynthetic protein CobC